jgi:hypothetical protein
MTIILFKEVHQKKSTCVSRTKVIGSETLDTSTAGVTGYHVYCCKSFIQITISTVSLLLFIVMKNTAVC